jgi:Flp pilus assembly protein TadD
MSATAELMRVALVHLEARELEGAVASYLRVLELDSHNALAHANLGVAFSGQGKLIEAVHHYRLALEIKPKVFPILTNLGRALRALGRHDEALTAYRDALAIRPEEAGPHINVEGSRSMTCVT